MEYHMFEKNTFCTGATFVPEEGGVQEDDGWIVTFVHNEDTDISQVRMYRFFVRFVKIGVMSNDKEWSSLIFAGSYH